MGSRLNLRCRTGATHPAQITMTTQIQSTLKTIKTLNSKGNEEAAERKEEKQYKLKKQKPHQRARGRTRSRREMPRMLQEQKQQLLAVGQKPTAKSRFF